MSEQEAWLLAAVALLTPPIGLVFFNVLFLRVCMVEETVGESLENYLSALGKVAKEKEKYQTRLLEYRRGRLGLSMAMVAEAAVDAEEGSLAAKVHAAGTLTEDATAAQAARAHSEHEKDEHMQMLRSMGISVPEDEKQNVLNGGAPAPGSGPAAPNGAAAVPAVIAAAANGGAAAPNGAAAVPVAIAAAANGGAAAPNGAAAVPVAIAAAANGQSPDQVTSGSGKISLLKALAAEPTSWPGGGGLDAEPPAPMDPKAEAELGGAVRRLMSGGDQPDS